MFEGFTAKDFDAYLPEKWVSNMYTLPRRMVKDKLHFLGKEIIQRLQSQDLLLSMHLSDDHPSLWNKKKVDTQWLFFSRDEQAQKELSEIIDTEKTLAATLADPTPLYRHLFLGAAVDQHCLEIGIRLHFDAWVDRKNLISLLEEPKSKQAFLSLLAKLPDQYEFGLVGDGLHSCATATEELFAQLQQSFVDNKGWIFWGVRFAAAEAEALGDAVLTQVLEIVDQLVPVYNFLAWSPSNDAVSMDNIVQAHKKAIEESHQELETQKALREARREKEEAQRLVLRQEVEERVRVEEQWRERERAIRRTQAKAAYEREVAAKEEAAQAALAQAQLAQTKEEQNLNGSDSPSENVNDAGSKVNAPKVHSSSSRKGFGDRYPNRGSNKSGKEQNEKRRFTKSASSIESVISDERRANIQVGDGVVVKKGFLKGRFGVVQKVEEKGFLKVLFGAMASRVSVDEVEGRGPNPSIRLKETKKQKRK